MIQKVLGELTNEQFEMFSKNPRFLGLKFPDVSKPETLEKRYVGKMSKKALSLMNGLLKMDPKDRLVGIKALTHPYFDDIRFKDSEFLKITEGEDLDEISNRDASRPIQSSHGAVTKPVIPAFEEKNRVVNSRAGITAYSGFDSSMKDLPIKRRSKKAGSKTKKINSIYGKKYSNGTIRSKDILNIYGNGEMSNTQYTSRNDEASASNTFMKAKKKSHVYKGIINSKSTASGAFPTQLTGHKLMESHEYNYDISTPMSNSILKTSPFKMDMVATHNNGSHNHQSRESLHNNIIVEDDKEINYSTSNHSTNRKSDRSRDRSEGRVHTDGGLQMFNERNKEKSFSKDLILQMKEKIKRKQRNNGEMSKILVLGSSHIEDSYKNTEYNDFGLNSHHNVSSFNNTKQSKKVSSLGRSPHKPKKSNLYNRSMYGHDSSNKLNRFTRDSFNKPKTNMKEIVLADSGSYISSIANVKNMALEQKMHLMQRESFSRGPITKPPGTSGGRLPKHFGNQDLPPKRYLPVSHNLNLTTFRN